MLTLANLFAIKCDQPYIGLSIDSRAIKPGEIFFAIKGENADGHAFVESALKAGAALAVVSEKVSDDPRVVRVPDTLKCLQEVAARVRKAYNPLTIAVTGSVGKTTTKNYIGGFFSKLAPTIYSKKSFNNHFGVPLTLGTIREDTRYACIEVGINNPGEMAPLAAIIQPDIAIVTNVGLAHIENFGSTHAIMAEKIKLAEHMRPGGIAVLNADDPMLASLRKEYAGNALWFGKSEFADIRLVARKVDGEAQELTVATPSGEATVRISPSDDGSMYAALACIAVAVAAKIKPAQISETLSQVTVDSRMKIIPFPHGRIIEDAYNASAASIINGINLIKSTGEDLVLVLGDLREVGGHLEEAYRQVLNEAKTCAKLVVAVGTTGDIWAKAAGSCGFDKSKLHIVERWSDAASFVTKNLPSKNTAVFVKGSRFSHMERVAIAISGRKSACQKISCSKYISCSECAEIGV